MTHLSIDLDYFFLHGLYDWDSGEEADRYYQKRHEELDNLLSLFGDREVRVYAEHHHIVGWLNMKDYDRVINIDFHSDIDHEHGGFRRSPLSEGNWANWFHNRGKSAFEWRYPVRDRRFIHAGFCSGDTFQKSLMGWGEVLRTHGTRNLPWNDILSISIVHSPDWCDNEELESALKRHPWLKENCLTRNKKWFVEYESPEEMYIQSGGN